MKKTFASILITSMVCVLFFPLGANAFEKNKIDTTVHDDFVVEPGKTEINLDPGESVVKNIKITNRIDHAVKFKLSTEDFIGSDDPDETVVLLGDQQSPYTLKNFIKPEISEFSLDFGEQITIPVKISVPLNSEPRGYYGALIISNEPDKETDSQLEQSSQTRIVSRIGSLFLVKVNGEGKQEGVVTSFKLIGPKKSIYEKNPQGFELAFKNTGSVHLVPYGTITVKNILGRTTSVVPVDAFFALPQATRYREILWNSGFGFGRYTATLSLFKGYDNQYAEAKLAFWVLPWKMFVAVFVVVLLVVAIIYYVWTRFEIKRK